MNLGVKLATLNSLMTGFDMFRKNHAVIAFLLLSVHFFYQNSSFAFPARDVYELETPAQDTGISVTTARVLLCNYNLLKKDFPYLRPLTNQQIDRWLIDHAAYISLPHATGNNQVNTPPSVDISRTVQSFRPLGYGRSAVFPVRGGLLDVKGAGVASNKVPKNRPNSNGLMSLGEAIREFTMQNLVEMIFYHAKSNGYVPRSGQPLTTVKSYAVIDWGFSILDQTSGLKSIHGGLMRAGAVIRQAHVRKMIPGSGNHFLPKNQANEVEDLLRHYGITTSGNIFDSVDVPDIQGTVDSRIFDFGTYVVMDRFTKDRTDPLGSEYFEDEDITLEVRGQRLLSFSDIPLPEKLISSLRLIRSEITSESSEFIDDDHEYPVIQPDKKISIPFELWGHNRTINPLGKNYLDNLRIMAELFANSINESESLRSRSSFKTNTTMIVRKSMAPPMPRLKIQQAKRSECPSVRTNMSAQVVLASAVVTSPSMVLTKKNVIPFFRDLEQSRHTRIREQFKLMRKELQNQIDYAFNSVLFKWYPLKFGAVVRANVN